MCIFILRVYLSISHFPLALVRRRDARSFSFSNIINFGSSGLYFNLLKMSSASSNSSRALEKSPRFPQLSPRALRVSAILRSYEVSVCNRMSKIMIGEWH